MERSVKEMQFKKGTEERFAEHIEEHAVSGDAQSVVAAADAFCWNIGWMMNLGDKKGAIVDEVLREHQPKTILELGTYCGYSSTRFLAVCPDATVTTIDPMPHPVTRRVWEKAGVLEKVTQLVGYADAVIPKLRGQTFDVIFIDHVKGRYLADLVLLEEHGIVTPGTVVIADNVLVFNIENYLRHVGNEAHYDTTVHESQLEYTEKHTIDGVAVSIRK